MAYRLANFLDESVEVNTWCLYATQDLEQFYGDVGYEQSHDWETNEKLQPFYIQCWSFPKIQVLDIEEGHPGCHIPLWCLGPPKHQQMPFMRVPNEATMLLHAAVSKVNDSS